MTYQQIKDYLDGLPMANALWWFIENVSDDNPHRNEVFFYLRGRMMGLDIKADYQFAKRIKESPCN